MKRALSAWWRSITDVRPGERIPTALMFLYGFLALTSYYVLKPVRNSVFVDRVGADNLPYVYILTAIVVTLVMVVYSRAVDRVKERALILGTFGFLASNLLVFRWWLAAGDSLWSSGAFYIWGKLYPLLVVSQFYLVGNLLFTTHQARRLFGLIGVGLILGGIAGSSISGLAATAVGTEDLLLIAGGILLLCALIVLALGPHLKGGEGASGRLMEEVSGDALRLLRESSHLKTIAAILGLTIVVGTLIDWQFNSAVEQFIPGEDAKTAFFGRFFAGLNVASVLIQLFFTGFVLRKLGIGFAMLALPAGLLLASAGMLLLPVLAMAVFAKGTEGALRYSLDQSTRELLYLPVPTEVKYKVKPLIDLSVYRGGTGLGGLLLILLVNVLNLPWGVTARLVSALALLCIGLWMVMTVRMRGEFRRSIRRLIDARDVDLEELIVGQLDGETVRELRRTLREGDTDQVLYALALLERYPDEQCTDDVARLLDYPSPTVRARALRILFEVRAGSYVDRVQERLRDDSLEVLVEAIHYLCAFDEGDPTEVMQGFLRHRDERIRVAATSCLVQHGDAGQVEMAEGILEEFARAERTALRGQAARLLGAIRPPTPRSSRVLRQLLDDPDPEVRREAIRAAGAAGCADLMDDLLDRLRSSGERAAAEEAIVALGPTAHPALLERLADTARPGAIRRRIPGLLIRGGDRDTALALLELLGRLPPSLRFEVLKALNRMRRDRTDLDLRDAPLDAIFQREVREAYEWAAREVGLPRADRPYLDLLRRTLAQRKSEAVERATRALGLRFPLRDLHAAYVALQASDPIARQRGFELLETTLPLRYRTPLDPLLHPDRGPAEIRRAAAERYGFRAPAEEEALRELTRADDPWVRALARVALGEEPPNLAEPEDWTAPERAWQDRPSGSGTEERTSSGERRRFMEIVERADVLRRTELFEELRLEDLAGLAALTEERTYRAGDRLFEEGGPGTELFIVVEGTVEAQRGGKTLFTAEAGQTVGDLSLLDGLPRNYDAVAVTDVRALVLGRDVFFGLLEERFRMVTGLLSHLSRVVRRLNERLAEETSATSGAGA